MKKIVSSICVATLFTTVAQADIFVGIDILNGSSMTYEREVEGSSSRSWEDKGDLDGYKIKLGMGDPKNVSFNLYYALLEDDFFKKDIKEFGVEVRPYINLGNNFGIYLQGGIGYGEMDIKIGEESSLTYVGANLGLGMSYLLANQIELNAGYVYNYQMWQDAEFGADTISTTANGGGIYIGLNFYFGKVGNTTQSIPEPQHSLIQSEPEPQNQQVVEEVGTRTPDYK